MKETLLQFAAYNMWANQQLLDMVANLPENQQVQLVASSFPSLQQTVLHMLDASSVWWQRLKLQERVTWPGQDFEGSLKDAVQQVYALDRQWRQWIGAASEHTLQHVFLYANSKREQFKQPTFQMLLHLFNHNTYHRGQLVTMLRQLGFTKVPPTDFIIWSRKFPHK
jgi:uncharacterized damage-inducible protein DinB